MSTTKTPTKRGRKAGRVDASPAVAKLAAMAHTAEILTAPARKPVVDLDALYHSDNGRIACGRHLGYTAQYTARDLSGQRVERITDAEAAEWLATVGEPIGCEDCNLGHAPQFIAYTVEYPWRSGDERGTHVVVAAMRLTEAHRDSVTYERVRTVSEAGIPPAGIKPRGAPLKTSMIWSALRGQRVRAITEAEAIGPGAG